MSLQSLLRLSFWMLIICFCVRQEDWLGKECQSLTILAHVSDSSPASMSNRGKAANSVSGVDSAVNGSWKQPIMVFAFRDAPLQVQCQMTPSTPTTYPPSTLPRAKYVADGMAPPTLPHAKQQANVLWHPTLPHAKYMRTAYDAFYGRCTSNFGGLSFTCEALCVTQHLYFGIYYPVIHPHDLG